MTLARSEIVGPIDKKFCTIDYVGEISVYAKNHSNWLHGAPPYTREIIITFLCAFLVFFSAFLGSRTARTESRIKVIDGSEYVFPVQEVLFWGSR